MKVRALNRNQKIVLISQGLIGFNMLSDFKFVIYKLWVTLHKSASVDKLFGNNN